MKTQKLPYGVKETKKNWIVDLDKYNRRERYEQGTEIGVVLMIDKTVEPNIFEKHNEAYQTTLDLLICLYNDEGVYRWEKHCGYAGGYAGVKGLRYYRKGYVIQ